MELQSPLSCTQVSMALRCAAQYEFRYQYGLRIPPSGALIQGSSYHKALARCFNLKMVDQPADIGDITATLSDAWDKQLADHELKEGDDAQQFDKIEWGEDDPGHLKDEAIKLSTLYVQEVAHTVEKPDLVEMNETITVGEIPFTLVADVVTGARIIDHKMKGRMFSANDLAQELQPVAYTYSKERRGRPFEYHVALKQKVPCIRVPAQMPSLRILSQQGDYDWFEVLVTKIAESIKLGSFPPNPTGWACSEKWCGYWNGCRGRYIKQIPVPEKV
jgi:hypothetical protein